MTLSSIAVARAVLDRKESTRWAPGFLARAAAAALPAPIAEMQIQTPAYLTDLGLRRWADPGYFFLLNIALDPTISDLFNESQQDNDRAINEAALSWETGRLEEYQAVGLLETSLYFHPDDSLATKIGQRLAQSSRTPASPRLLIELATLLASSNPDESRRLLETAARHYTVPSNIALTRLRIASILVKRTREFALAHDFLSKMKNSALRWGSRYEISPADASVLCACVDNLRALIHTYLGQHREAVELMEVVVELMTTDLLVTIEVDMAARYRGQARVNLAQALEAIGDRERALITIRDHLTRVRIDHPYSLSEGLGVASAFMAKAGRFDEGLAYALEADKLIRHEASPLRLLQVRKIAAICQDGMGNSQAAELILEAAENDPLGLRCLGGKS